MPTSPAPPRKRRLEDEFRGAIRVRGYSFATEQAFPPRSQVQLGNEGGKEVMLDRKELSLELVMHSDVERA